MLVICPEQGGKGKGNIWRARPAVYRQGKRHSARVTAIIRGGQLQPGLHSKFQVCLKYAMKEKYLKETQASRSTRTVDLLAGILSHLPSEEGAVGWS